MGSTTVRITRNTWKSLQETARQTGMTMQEIMEKSVEEYRRKRLLEETNNAFLNLKKKPGQWKEEQEERQLWDKTLGDNLEDKQ